MVQLYIDERYAADQRAQLLQEAHTARLLRQAHAPQQSRIVRVQAWWRNHFTTSTRRRAAEHVAAR
jgi:hypothetical protein